MTNALMSFRSARGGIGALLSFRRAFGDGGICVAIVEGLKVFPPSEQIPCSSAHGGLLGMKSNEFLIRLTYS